MNTPVTFKQAELLKEKGFDKICLAFYNDKKQLIESSNPNFKDSFVFDNNNPILAPTIAEVIMWLYKEHKIWISAKPTYSHRLWMPILLDISKENIYDSFAFNSPEEAYQAAIEYTLTNLI
jgi:hypothetical protein